MDCDRTDSSNFKSFAFECNGTIIDIAINNSSNRLFIIITEFGNIGTLISADKSTDIIGEEDNEDSDVYEIRVLFGDAREEYLVIARTLAQSIAINRPILFGLALKDVSSSSIETIRQALLKNKSW